MTEDSVARTIRMQGHDIKKIHKGGDLEVQKRDLRGRRIGKPITVEVKTGSSPLSDAQKRRKRQLGRRYKIVRL